MKTAGICLLENNHTSLLMWQWRMETLFLYNPEPWIMNRNDLHYHCSFYLSKLTKSIPSQAHQLICEMLEINFSPVLLTVTHSLSTFTNYIVTIVTVWDKAWCSRFEFAKNYISFSIISFLSDLFSMSVFCCGASMRFHACTVLAQRLKLWACSV